MATTFCIRMTVCCMVIFTTFTMLSLHIMLITEIITVLCD